MAKTAKARPKKKTPSAAILKEAVYIAVLSAFVPLLVRRAKQLQYELAQIKKLVATLRRGRRFCAHPDCANRLTGRKDQKFCSDSCRIDASLLRRAENAA